MLDQKYAIAAGNAWDGLQLIGPFDSGEEANEYADRELHGEEWHVVDLLLPYKEENAL